MGPGLLHAQQQDSLYADTLKMPLDSLVSDTLIMAQDSLVTDSLSARPGQSSGVEAEVNYTATDSLVFSMDGGSVELYGDAVITYEEIELVADYIRYDMDNNTVTAFGLPDSAGQIKGKPVFTDPSGSFESKELRYNFKTKKAYVEEVVTEQEGGFLHSQETKMQQNGHIHLKDGKFTTCDAAHPHFYIAITKGISMPGDKIVSGPAYLVLEDVPLPLGIPFGFFPNTQTKSSGLLIPEFGEEPGGRGFYVRDGGYYFALNDFFDLRLTGDLYSNGTLGLRVGSNYKLNYKFSGNLSVKYFKNVAGYQNIEGSYSVSRDYAIGWSHSQDSRANPSSTFRASVNLSSSSYDRNHTRNINSVMTNTKQSSISYSKSFPNSPFNLSASMTHSQNSNNKTVNLNLPKVNFNMRRINPFERKNGTGPKRWYEDIQLSYTSILENKINTYDSLLFTSSVFDDMETGFKQTIPLSLSIRPFRKKAALQSFALTPSLNYNGMIRTKQVYKWVEYTEEDDGSGGINYVPEVQDTLLQKLNYAHSLYPSFSTGWSPKIYGMYNFTGDGRMEAIRHAMSPSVSFSYVPDMGSLMPNYYREIYDEINDTILGEYSIFEDVIYGTPSGSKASGSVSFSLRNNIEAKMRSKNDTIDEVEKVSILDNLSFSTSYNVFHDNPLTPAWSAVSFNGNTSIFKRKLNISFRGSLDPFGFDSTRTRTRETYYSQTGKLVRLTSFSVSSGFRLQSKGDTGNKNPDGQGSVDREETRLNNRGMSEDPNSEYNPTHEDYYGDYVDFDIPWSLRVDYSFSYSKPKWDASIVQTIRASGDFSLSPNWKIGFNTGFDLDSKEFTTTNVSIYRDLHCWEMRISVVPFGNYRSYNFQINAKSNILRDLKYKKTQSWRQNDGWYDSF